MKKEDGGCHPPFLVRRENFHLLIGIHFKPGKFPGKWK